MTQDGQDPVHAILPTLSTGEVVLQCEQVILGEAGIEKVGTFCCYDPADTPSMRSHLDFAIL